ncbi:hypothetical protein PoB_000780000 [Plakobranchus ocellatus]|uniref:Uncharacterized protein n=1 Tax=Plakobranchus ocellatus TaxID=259542 RepID=A0AAV3YFN5_9GAST|nr:hypothetical protein PoB_000780000 [Plakobranchus ocellatus]
MSSEAYTASGSLRSSSSSALLVSVGDHVRPQIPIFAAASISDTFPGPSLVASPSIIFSLCLTLLLFPSNFPVVTKFSEVLSEIRHLLVTCWHIGLVSKTKTVLCWSKYPVHQTSFGPNLRCRTDSKSSLHFFMGQTSHHSNLMSREPTLSSFCGEQEKTILHVLSECQELVDNRLMAWASRSLDDAFWRQDRVAMSTAVKLMRSSSGSPVVNARQGSGVYLRKKAASTSRKVKRSFYTARLLLRIGN